MPVCRSGKPQHNGTGAGTSDWLPATTNTAMNPTVFQCECRNIKKNVIVNQWKNTQNMLFCIFLLHRYVHRLIHYVYYFRGHL